MIEELEVTGFKRFSHERFQFSPLTILTGLNGAGKTSLLQSLLIAWEAANSRTNSLRLNGPFDLQLGTAADVLNWHSKSPIEIAVMSSNECLSKWTLALPVDDALYLTIASRSDSVPFSFSGESRAFTYLSAERLGPRNFLGTSPVPDEELEVGVQGEHSAHVLSVLGNKIIEDRARYHPSREDLKPMLLKYELEQWLAEIVRPVEISAERYPGASVTELSFRSPGSQRVRAPNMGFGISYALPVILGGLIAKKGGLLLVENPEAHLHPAGQSRMGVFLAWLAGRGVQVVLETHSDHVLNGIRRAIAEHCYLPAKDAVAHYFSQDGDKGAKTSVERLTFNETGSISHWPRGFFDQFQIDVASLGRIRRKK